MSGQGKNAKREGARSNELYQLQALNRIVSAITGTGQPPAPLGIATETTLQGVLAAIDTMRDFEVRLVEDSAVTPVTWLEVRYWDAQTGALGTPEYYLPGSTTPGTPTGALSYINAQTLLTQILGESIDQGLSLDQIVPSNIDKLKAANDLVKTFAYYGVDPVNNPSGNKNILSITYSSAALTLIPDATETFVWDIDDDVLSITLS